MANIEDENVFQERKSLEEVFLQYAPFSLREALIALNVVSNEEEEEDSLDDELITINLKKPKEESNIESDIENTDDA